MTLFLRGAARGLLLAFWLGATWLGSMAWASDRVALVIGNSNYRQSPLLNPRNDANAMADLLTRAGFKVDKHLDTDLGQLQSAVNRFGATIKDPKIKLGLFYYAGHGLQQDWRNYLVPVSAQIRAPADVTKQTVDVSDLLRYMQEAQGRSFLVILDACRDDPFAGTFRPAAKGLSQFDAPVGSLLAYATAPGDVAEDGDGQNGLYTSYLVREFSVPGVKLEDAFKRIRLGVRLASKGDQIPWESTSLEEDLYLVPQVTPVLNEAEKDQLLEREMTHWLRVKNTQNPEELAGFIREFPSGSASELAQSRMNRMLAAMREAERVAAAAKAKAKEAEAIASREAEAKKKLEEAERERLAAEQAEAERIRLAQVRQQEALRLQAEEAQRRAAAQLAQEQARLAQEALERAAAEKREADRIALAQAEAKRLAEAARQAERQQQAAQAEAQRLAALQAQALEAQRLQAQRAEQEKLALERAAALAREAAERLAAEKQAVLAATAAAALPASTQPATLAPTPYFKGYAEHRRNYHVGDEYHISVIDQFSKSSKPLVMKVTEVDDQAERVIYNGGEFVSDLMGNTTTNQRGVLSTPRQFYPAELFVGKKWHTRFKQTRANGTTYTFYYDLKVVGRETVTVPAGTFETFKIQGRGFNVELGAYLERNIWVAPGINNDIVHEIYVRLRNGRIDQHDRQELVSYVQSQR